MSYEFFFSYSRSNNDKYLKEFYNHLREDIRLKLGLPLDSAVGFFDQQKLELGEEWENGLVTGIQQSKVFIAVGSPAYFLSKNCGQEWALFKQKCNASGNSNTEKLIKSICWVPFEFATLPTEIQKNQLTFLDPQAIQNTKGFRHILQQKQSYRSKYHKLIDQLSDSIIEAGKKYPIPAIKRPPKLGNVQPAFGNPIAESPPLSGHSSLDFASRSSLNHVHFVYVAAHPIEFGNARPPEAYLNIGGPDWQPYLPTEDARVHILMQRFASQPGLGFGSDVWPFDTDLINRIEQAKKQRELVIIVVDPWTVFWDSRRASPTYQSLLATLDSRVDYHWSILVPWNENDATTNSERDAILAAVNGTFDRHIKYVNPIFFRDRILSPRELKKVLAKVLTQLKEEIRKSATIFHLIPDGPTRPIVSGPSGGNE